MLLSGLFNIEISRRQTVNLRIVPSRLSVTPSLLFKYSKKRCAILSESLETREFANELFKFLPNWMGYQKFPLTKDWWNPEVKNELAAVTIYAEK